MLCEDLEVLNEYSQIVSVYISATNLRNRDTFSKSDPYAQIYVKDQDVGLYKLMGDTEKLKNTQSPEFSQEIRLIYNFEMKQEIKIEFRDDDGNGSFDMLGVHMTSLGHVVG